MKLHILPAFHDNYLWLLEDGLGSAWAVDPGDPAVIEATLASCGLSLAGLLITHHHPDHTGGIAALTAGTPLPVYGPAERIAGITQVVQGGERLSLPGLGEVQVIAVPGHTLGHVAYYLPAQSLLFCGDTLFSSGCGRLFEGTPEQMHASLQTISALPDATLVCCAHEYTLANLRFALAVEPANADIRQRFEAVTALRGEARASVPTRLEDERRWNPFLRCNEPAVVAAASAFAGAELSAGNNTFAAIRRWKDGFR